MLFKIGIHYSALSSLPKIIFEVCVFLRPKIWGGLSHNCFLLLRFQTGPHGKTADWPIFRLATSQHKTKLCNVFPGNQPGLLKTKKNILYILEFPYFRTFSWFQNKWLQPLLQNRPVNQKQVDKSLKAMEDTLANFENFWLDGGKKNYVGVKEQISVADIWACCELEQPSMAG